MRVIAGSAKHIPLKSIDGLSTRPTTDKIKETLFNIINFNLSDCVFLDLFAGSGAIGIEALSRGAAKAYFVENNRKAGIIIKENLEKTKLSDNASVIFGDAYKSILNFESSGIIFDIIFIDPPYNKKLEEKAINSLEKSKVINENSIIIIEMSLQTNLEFLNENIWEIIKIKEYKTNKHIFVKRRY